MLDRLIADGIVVVHFAYVTFVVGGLIAIVLGGALGWNAIRNRWFRAIHLSMILIVVMEAWAGITCPLTTWEKYFRGRAGDVSYQGDFVASWLHHSLFFDAPPWVFTLSYSLFAVLVIGTAFLVPARWRPNRPISS